MGVPNSETSSNLPITGRKTPGGQQIGLSSSDKIGFFGATPVDQPAASADLRDALEELGLIAAGGDDTAFESGSQTYADGSSIIAGTTNGLTFGSATTQVFKMFNGVDLVLATTTGTKIGTASTQKLGFLGATPVVRQGSTTDLKDLLVTFGLLVDSGATPLNLDGGAFTCGNQTFADGSSIAAGTSSGLTIGTASTQVFTMGNGVNIALASTTGTKIGTVSTQKLGFLGATPRGTSTLAASAMATTGAVSTTTGAITSWGFSTEAQANSIATLVNEIRALLVAFGLAA